MSDLTPGMRKAIELRDLDERSTEETASNDGNFSRRGKGSSVSWAKEIAREIKPLCRISLDVWKGRFPKDR